MSEQQSSDDPYYKTYVDHRNKLYELYVDQTKSLDKAILTLAGGAIGLSIVFLDKLADPDDKSNWWILYCSWAFLVLSIVLTMLSHFTSAKAILGQIDHLDTHYKSISEEEGRERWYAFVTRSLGLISILTFIIGIAGLLAFSAVASSSRGDT